MPIYMKYPGIHGTGKGKFSGWIELENCQLGSLGGSGSTMRPEHLEIVITKGQDQTTPHLARKYTNGDSQNVTIAFVKGDAAPYLVFELENTMIVSYRLLGGSGPTEKIESIGLNFTKITYGTQGTATP
ncbi:MAG TPA: type VI secretion system tube protein Hcp [Aridibacter sp.]|nr:type VI secretion system tube protein Hcp [Aridibacter sp.]